DYRASVALRTVRPAPAKWVTATVQLQPARAVTDAAHADWFDVTAWQGAGPGRGGLVVDPLVPVSPGVWRTKTSFPVYGEWKALLRLHSGSSLQAVPVYLPSDPAIPARAVPAWPRFRRSFEPDKRILQREA